MLCTLLILVASAMDAQRQIDEDDAEVDIGDPDDARLMKRRMTKQRDAEKKNIS